MTGLLPRKPIRVSKWTEMLTLYLVTANVFLT